MKRQEKAKDKLADVLESESPFISSGLDKSLVLYSLPRFHITQLYGPKHSHAFLSLLSHCFTHSVPKTKQNFGY